MLGLNAPYGAPCFLTFAHVAVPLGRRGGLNAPYGAPCFLTDLELMQAIQSAYKS